MEAFYCGNQSTSLIVFSDNAINHIGDNYGREAVAAVVAHEFGHARQHLVSGYTSDKIWTAAVDELQADCIAGVYMRRATPFQLSESQVDKVSKFMRNIGDYIITERDWHGTPEMRSASFRYGYRAGDLNNCLASENKNWGKAGEKIEQEIKKAPETIDSLIKWGQDILK
jgi:predicted metalloprotease